MIFYKNIKPHKKTAEKNIVFSIFDDGVISNQDDSIAKTNSCKNSYNLSVSDGTLKTGLGFVDLEVPYDITDLTRLHTFNFSGAGITEIRWIDCYRFKNLSDGKNYYNLDVIAQNGKTYACGLTPTTIEVNMPIIKGSLELGEIISSTEYRIDDYDCLLYFVEDGMVYSSAYVAELYNNVPPLISCVVHYNKFFGITNTNRNELVYQSDLNLRQWSDDNASYIQFLDQRGFFTKLVAFNDYVYLFREYGITKISEYSNAGDFSFTHLYTSASRIFENSICVCGNLVYFMSRDGLYTFNGTKVQKICTNYDKYFLNLDNTNCSSCSLNGKYYLATRLNFNDDKAVGCENETYKNNVLFQIDLNTYEVEILRGVDIKRIIKIDIPEYSRVVACFNNNNKNHLGQLGYYGKIFTESNKKLWQSFTTDLGYQGKKKKIKEILITTQFDCQLKITSDCEEKIYSFSGSDKEQRISCSCYGNNFQFEFSTDKNDCKISKPKIVFDVVV